MHIEKYESRRIRGEIRHVLLTLWDPIGIQHEPNAQDEYDGYIGDVLELLMGNSSDKEIADYLGRIVEDRMGLKRQNDAAERTVRQLRAIQLPKL